MKENPTPIGVKKRLLIYLKVLKITFQIRPLAGVGFFVAASVEIASFIIAMFASAKIVSILAHYLANGNAEDLWLWFWIDIAMVISIALSNEIMAGCKRLIYFRFIIWSRKYYLDSVSKVDINAFYDTNFRNQINKTSMSYYWELSELAYANLDLIYGLMRLIAILMIVSQIQWWITPVIILFLLPTIFSESKRASLQWFINDSRGDDRQIIHKLERLLQNAVSLMEIKTLQLRSRAINIIHNLDKNFYKDQEEAYKYATRYVFASSVAGTLGITIGSAVLIFQVLGRSIGFDQYLFLSASLLRVEGSLVAIFGTLARTQEKINFADSFFAITNTKPIIVDFENAKNLNANTLPEIRFENVCFKYPEKRAVIFENLNLTIKKGEHIALVGENGAGKSTLIKLLLRLYKPDKGRITLDGVDINDIAIDSWYKKIATLFQDFNEYPASIRENVEIASKTKNDSKVRLENAAKLAGIDKMVNRFEHGWDTVLDSSFEKGTEPSGGQWQRVALARIFYRQGKVLILDEPTASIDAKAEYDIFNHIFKQYNEKTVIIVSHRFSTVRRADRIIVLDKGRIVEEGTHKKLMRNKNLYNELFTKQAEGYK
ncbi:MAG: ABC transporter ATP-binding protein [Patescibacteria group bacterium]